MPGKEPNPDDAPYRPVPPGGPPWPGYPNPKKLAKKRKIKIKPHDQSVNA